MVQDPRTPVRAHGLRPVGRFRTLAGPRPLRVQADARNLPHTVLFEGAMRAVHAIQDRWRIDDEWWRDAPVARTYYELRLEGDRVITVYLDEREGAWWLQRY